MSSFSLTNAEQLWCFFNQLEERQVDIKPYLDECLIPEEALEIADLKLTSKQNYDFLELVARREGLPQIGWEVGRRFGAQAFGSLGIQALEQMGLDTFNELSYQVQFHASGAHFFLLKDNDKWRFCNIGSVAADSYGYAIGEFYGVAVMIDLVRRSLGVKNYLPKHISLRSANWQLLPKELAHANVRFEQRLLSIDLPPNRIRQKRRKLVRQTTREASSFSENIKALLSSHLTGPGVTLSQVSSMTGISSRSIQRHLAAEGNDFRSILGEARMLAAADVLKETRASVAEVAAQFGFKHASHFVRAFKRCHGITPRLYRSQ